MLNEPSKLYNTLLKIYVNKFNRLEKSKKKTIAIKKRPKSLNLKGLFSGDDEALEVDAGDNATTRR